MKFLKSAVSIWLLLILLNACTQQAEPTFEPYGNLFTDQQDEEINQLMKDWKALDVPQPRISMKVDFSWLFSEGNPSEGLEANQIQEGITLVDLPHRVLLPNTPLWYSRKMRIEEPGVFYIRADDGEQLYIDGKRIKRLDRDFFKVEKTGDMNVVVRVLNNAMSGGLNRFSFIRQADYNDFVEARLKYIRLKHACERVVLMKEKIPGAIDLLKISIRELNDASLSNLETRISDYPWITGPWIIRLDSNSYKIMVMLEEDGDATLKYGSSMNLLNQKITGTGKIITFPIMMQDSDALYYQVSVKQSHTPVYHFETKEKDSFSFNVWADSQSGWEKFYGNLKNVRHDDAFGIAAGDLVGNGSDVEHWNSFYNLLSVTSAERPYYLVAGNHDYDGYYDDLIPVLYRELNPREHPNYFMWMYSNCAFIALDPNVTFPVGIPSDSPQHGWFMRQLDSPAWKQATWRFVIMHQPPYSQGWAGYQGDQTIRDLLDPLLKEKQIDFIIAGHTHDYERLIRGDSTHSTTLLIVGGAGGSLEPAESSPEPRMDTIFKTHHIGRFSVNGNSIRFEAIDIDGNRIDQFSFNK